MKQKHICTVVLKANKDRKKLLLTEETIIPEFQKMVKNYSSPLAARIHHPIIYLKFCPFCGWKVEIDWMHYLEDLLENK